jgi:small subunit ribosomal protein S9
MENKITIGRRKEASARVKLSSGSGSIVVNGKDYKQYFPQTIYQLIVEQPFKILEQTGKYDVMVNVSGGGVKGQAEAIRLGICRHLQKENPEWRTILKKAGMLTRDPRVVERKKPGRRKARRSYQFSKR